MSIQDEIPKSRLTISYRTAITGKTITVAFPFRILVLADLSAGTSKDRALELGDRLVRSVPGRNLDGLMRDMSISCQCTVPNRIDPQDSATLDLQLPVDAMAAFAPDHIAHAVPKLRALLLLKQLLVEMLASIDNRKPLRQLVQTIYGTPELYEGLLARLKDFAGLRLPAPGAQRPTGQLALPASSIPPIGP